MPFFDMVKFLYHFALKIMFHVLAQKTTFMFELQLLILEFILKLSPLIGRLLVALQQAN